MFCGTDITTFELVNLRCKPEKAVGLREQYDEVNSSYYMNKKHWNSISTNGEITKKQIASGLTL